MTEKKPTYRELEARLAEAEDIIAAIEKGQVDAIVSPERIQVLRLQEIEAALQESQDRFRLVVENSRDGIHQLDLRTNRYVFMSSAQERLTGFSREELNGMSLEESMERLHPDDRETVPAYLERVISGEEPGEPMEYRWRVQSGGYRWFSDSRKLIRDKDGAPVSLIGVSRDITRRKRTETALRRLNETLEQRVAQRTAEVEQQADRLRALTLQLSQTEQQERQRLAQTLHDYIQQYIVAAKIRAEWIAQSEDIKQIQNAGREVNRILDEVLEATRSLAVDLYPPVLEIEGLSGGLCWLAELMREKNQFTVNVSVDDEAEPASEEMRFLLFGCARELLFNVLKHAGVQEADVSLVRANARRIALTVQDQGRGFDPALIRSSESHSTLGLFSIQQRLSHLGGRLDIDSAPEQGTRITLIAPGGEDC